MADAGVKPVVRRTSWSSAGTFFLPRERDTSERACALIFWRSNLVAIAAGGGGEERSFRKTVRWPWFTETAAMFYRVHRHNIVRCDDRSYATAACFDFFMLHKNFVFFFYVWRIDSPYESELLLVFLFQIVGKILESLEDVASWYFLDQFSTQTAITNVTPRNGKK